MRISATLRSVAAITAALLFLTLGFLLYYQDFGRAPATNSGNTPFIIHQNSSNPPSALTSSNWPTATTNTSLGLKLELQVSEESNGALTVKVDELNTLNAVNNVTAAKPVKFPPAILNAFSGCAGVDLSDGWTSVLGGPAIFAILQGNYGMNNYTAGQPLTLYNTTYAETGCPGYPVDSYAYAPLSANGTSATFQGYWTGGEGTAESAAYHRFAAGVYTVVALDEWGRVVISTISL